MTNWDNQLDNQYPGHNPYEAPDVEPEEVEEDGPCEECNADVGDRCPICGIVVPEPAEDSDAWSGGFAENH